MVRLLASLLLLLACSGPAAATDWHLVRTDTERDIKVYVQQNQPGQPYQRFYAQVRLLAPLNVVVAVLNDVAAEPEWVARVEQARLLRRQGDESWVYTAYHLPYPFRSRDAVLHIVTRRDASGAVTLESQAVPGLVGLHTGYVRLYDAHTTWKLTSEADGWLQIELWGEGTPGGYIPSWLYNYSLPDGPAQTLRNLRRMVQRPRYLPLPRVPIRHATGATSAH